ncbi:hypothetical protein [Cryptosporangium arvum]|uniref:DUF4386 domain-containing protein n=1 Tax=Cryptosporangium arvum DSM 44712 TaxID=927661 RepID=A0A010Z552_9ACTN|nr:hypothetical protein [Cryptosporangium arvum]EXG82478.1 hypothetical protein CryarDRAFT_3666 [Cryptosporangium arvum DSM 44712]
MTTSPGGICGVVSGALFLVKAGLDLVVGEPPSDRARLPSWVDSHHLPLALTNETMALGAVLLIPLALALHQRLHGSAKPWAGIGCAALATAVPVILVLAVVQGRLVYPVYGIDLDAPATLALTISLYYGGAHLVSLLVGAALVVLGLSTRHPATWAVAGVAAGALQLVGAYPWLIGPVFTAITEAAFAAWLIVAGVTLTRPAPVLRPPDAL